MASLLADFTQGRKVIPRSYGRISHLPGSKMIDDKDKLLGEQETSWLLNGRPPKTSNNKPFNDTLFISEKIDGMNASVYKKDGLLYPLVRHGFDCRTNPMPWIRSFADYVNDHAERFWRLLQDGERACGEWMIKTHTIQYILQVEPFIIFDIIDEKSQRESYKTLQSHCLEWGFTTVSTWDNTGPILPADALKIISSGGYSGARTVNGIPEGVVYRLECNDKFICSGKYVSHPDLGNRTIFHAMENVFNVVRDQDRKYLKL